MSIRQREGVDEGVCEAGRWLGGVVPSTRTVGRPPHQRAERPWWQKE